MSSTVRIPTPLRGFTGGQSALDVSAGTLDHTLTQVTDRYPDLRRHLFTNDGQLRNFVIAFVNDDNARDLEGGLTPVRDGDTVTIIPSIAGGAPTTADDFAPVEQASE